MMDALIEAHQLHPDLHLVMVHSHQHIELSEARAQKDGVWREGLCCPTPVKSVFDGRRTNVPFSGAKKAIDT